MKKKITLLTSIFIIAMMLFTSNVFAAEIFKHEGKTYVIDEVTPNISSLGDEVDCWGMDQSNNYIFLDYLNSKFYKVTETSCTVMSSQEILDLMNDAYHIHNFIDQNDLNIYQEKFPTTGFREEGYIITEDKTVDSNKEYLERTESQEGGNISIGYQTAVNPDLENGTYYERVYLITPKTAKIDENISYYKYDVNSNIFVKVENPKEEDAYMYAIIGEAEEIEPEKIGKMSQETFDKIFTGTSYVYYLHYDEENKEIYILITYDDDNKSAIYKVDGTLVKEFDSLMEIYNLGNKFFIAAPRDENWNIDDSKITIIDNEGNVVHESTNLPYLETIDYGKYITYLKNYDFEVSEFYNMYEYELLSEDNQVYEGKDLTIKTSGELNRLVSVKVNGVELPASNYTKTSGSTIITLKNDYLKTLSIGIYTLELGYVDGTKIETKFIVDKIYNDNGENGEDSDSTQGNTGEGTTGEVAGGTAGGNAPGTTEGDKDKGEKDDTPQTGNATERSNIAMYIAILAVVIGAVITYRKRK